MRPLGSEGWQGNYNKTLGGRKNCEYYVCKEIQETNIVFSNLSFFFFFFSLLFFCVYYFSFALLTTVRTTKWQRAHINKASNINKIMNYNYVIMAKSRYDAILNFPKKYLICSYLLVTILTYNMQDNFCYT